MHVLMKLAGGAVRIERDLSLDESTSRALEASRHRPRRARWRFPSCVSLEPSRQCVAKLGFSHRQPARALREIGQQGVVAFAIAARTRCRRTGTCPIVASMALASPAAELDNTAGVWT